MNGNITGNPGYWVSRVEPSHHDSATAYVTLTGYRRDDLRPFIYKITESPILVAIDGDQPIRPVEGLLTDLPRSPS